MISQAAHARFKALDWREWLDALGPKGWENALPRLGEPILHELNLGRIGSVFKLRDQMVVRDRQDHSFDSSVPFAPVVVGEDGALPDCFGLLDCHH